MKTIGIIGGLSPQSTMAYYAGLNEGAKAHLGGLHNAKILLNSLDFGEFVSLKEKGDWETQEHLLVKAAKGLERAGADFIVLATNTMHKMADLIEEAISIPFLHLADATAQEVKAQGVDKIALLGTRYTMEMDFYKERLARHGLKILIPNDAERMIVNNVIYNELCQGIIRDESRKGFKDIITRLGQEGAQGIILGCTEIAMLIKPKDTGLKVFDTTAIHIEAALNYACK